ncbi:flagellar basal body-associated FliL family protein [Allosphingosinicella sp.]|uniref:flagellar basal body-associated FliL family protein n=1 Tax=Allosphingosinicella sp. TaxID=2823234 RepID=UPI003783D8AA
MTDIAIEAPAEAGAKPKKKGGKKKKLILLLIVVLLGAGGGYYAMYGLPGSHRNAAAEQHADEPQLVVRDGMTASDAQRAAARQGRVDPHVFKTTYIPLEGNFTSNLRGGDNFVQVGLGLSTFYDDHVKEAVERNMMAIRSAIILALSEADPVEITTLSGKEALKNALKDAINRVLTNREGFGGIDDVYFTSFVTQ